ncbi:MAG: LCP family protein [Clostridia bacterium]|nr:LCP family protein [Clostridia bacterium]
MKKSIKIPIIILSCFVGVCIVLGGIYGAFYLSGKNLFRGSLQNIDADNIEVDENEIIYKDKTYTLNKNIISMLFIGIDRDNINENEGYGENGQADSIFVMALDTKTGSVKILPISRETMVDVDIYSSTGIYTGVKNEQVCLSYAYGGTTQESCENVLKSVKRILYGININSYVAIELDGMAAITDKIGGVEVEALEDMNGFGFICTKGEKIKLYGKDAITYIQTRGEDLEANQRRMERQKQFLSAFASTSGNAIMKDYSNILTFYNTLSPYLSTNLSLSQITYVATNFIKADIGSSFEFMSIPGEHKKGDKYIEFYPDEDALLDAIVDIFYVAK